MDRCLVALIVCLGGCGFQVTGSGPADAREDGGAISDGEIADMMIDEMPPPIDGDRSDWWDPQWTQRRRIALDTSTFTGPVTDFPMLVRIPALTGVAVNGADLRFVSIDASTTYPYDLDSFSAVGSSAIWVKMSIAQTTTDTELWLYYGNPTAAPVTSSQAVFAGNHTSVHHLGSLLDATNNGHNAQNPNPGQTPSANVGGRIGAARTFDGNDDFLTLANGDGAYDFTTSMYASAWIRVAGFEDQYQAIIAKGDSSWRLARANNGNGVAFGWTNGGSDDNVGGGISVANGAWHHVAIVQTPTTKYVYVDGQLDASVQNTEQLDNNSYSVRFGMNEESTSGGQRYWHGDMDEIRISSIARDAHWILAEHETTKASFTTVGVAEIY